MNFIIYYLNASGFPAFTFVIAESAKEAEKEFKRFNPDVEAVSAFVKCEDLKEKVRFLV